ncbi:MAG: hypothetical protein ACOX68_07930 [Candidatus Limivicinus sp.]|jgi:hypothetical protein
MEAKLKFPYPAVYEGEKKSYGGSQTFSDNKNIKKCGCGITAALDLILYLNNNHCNENACILKNKENRDKLDRKEYSGLLSYMCNHFFPIVSPFGMNGISLALGLNRFFHRFNFPYKAVWNMNYKSIWYEMVNMLKNDIPVILSIGQNIPFFWQNNKLNFYVKTQDGQYIKKSSAKAHFITVTGMDDNWLTVSSWGSMYYISRNEYYEYVKEYSAKAVNNILIVKETV